MNGKLSSVVATEDDFSMDYWTPVVTYAGDKELFGTLANNLTKSIPTDSVEWRRSYDRPIKHVKVSTSFIPFSQDKLPSEKDCHLVKRPIFHIYWSECTDIDVYKASLRDDIDNWLKTLSKAKIQDWMIVLVETYDIKKSNKLLPRTTVLDKIRSDFASKHGDRCLSIINPIKSESRSAESWRGLINRFRHLMLTAYDRTLLKFEEIIREHREKRNQPGWNFCHYFLLQEELAFVLETLNLYDEALVQYDELDALFTQFILNSNVGDTPSWLSSFQSPLNNWSGVKLNKSIDNNTRLLIANCKASLLDLRSYLFSRQCKMLLSLNRHWEVAQRCLIFVHDTIHELRILEIQRPEGSVECWAFLCALEILNACQSSTANIENNQLLDLCSLHTATLWALARDKLESLGKLCGLMPGSDPTSEQLHTVVYLIAGMGDSESNDHDPKTPTDKLKEALSSKETFRKQYLYHTELAMGTHKHVKRNRSARLIGKELARFYSDMDENQKAVVFLQDALQTYTSEGWTKLAAQTQHELAQCYKKMDDVERYAKACSAIASSEILHLTIRNSYLDEMLGYSKMLKDTEPLLTDLSNSFVIEEMEVNITDKVIQDCEVKVIITLKSLLPRPITCTKAELSIEEVQKPSVKRKGIKNSESNIELLLKCRVGDRKPIDPCLIELPVTCQLVLQEDRSICSANVHIDKNKRTIVKRSDSVKFRKPSTSTKGDFTNVLSSGDEEIVLQPGLNTLILIKRVDQPGYYRVNQLSLIIEKKLEFLSPVLEPKLCYLVAKTQPTISLNCSRDFLAGLAQNVELVVSSGSVRINEGSKLKLRTSRGLTLPKIDDNDAQKKGNHVNREIEVTIPHCEPFNTTTLKLTVLAELPPKKDSSSLEHKLNVQCPWGAEESIILHFTSPLMSMMKLHTAKRRKFIQIVVTGLSKQLLQLTEPQLTSGTSVDVQFRSLNPTAGQKLVIGNGIPVSFMWEIEIGNEDERTPIPIKTEFRVKYIAINDIEDVDESDETSKNIIVDDPLHLRDLEKVEKESNVYWCNFDVTDYSTLFMVSSKVEAVGSSGEFCRVGSMCHLCLTVTRMQQNNNQQHQQHNPQLMYEVLADQTMWAVYGGRTAGIVSLEIQEKQSVTLDVMPLTSGFLPLPVVRLSRYIPAAIELKNDTSRKNDLGSGAGPRLEPFSPGQVYNASKAQQVHVLPAAPVTIDMN